MRNPVTEYHKTKKTGLPAGKGKRIQRNTLEFIVIHHWGDPAGNPQFDAIVRALAVTYPVSANYVCEEGRLAQIAAPDIITWHAMDANRKSCGIENNPRCSLGDLIMCAKAVAWVWKFARRKIPLRKHSQIVVTACPGQWSWWVDSGELYRLAEKVYNGKDIDMAITEQIWGHKFKNYLGNDVTAQGILYWLDANQAQLAKLLVETHERTKAIAEAVAKVEAIDWEAIAKKIEGVVNKIPGDSELPLTPEKEGATLDG